MDRLCNDEHIAKCLLNLREDFLNVELPDHYASLLAWDSIRPYKFVVGVQEEKKAYICMSFRYDRSKTAANMWKPLTVAFYCFCHREMIKTDYGVLRYDFLANRISELLLDTRSESWVGKMEFDGMEDIVMNDTGEYVGVRIQFKNTEFL